MVPAVVVTVIDSNHNELMASLEEMEVEPVAQMSPEEQGQQQQQQQVDEEGQRKSDEIEGSDAISFCPAAYIQRYCRVHDVIEQMLESPRYKSVNAAAGKTIMEVGCAEFGMMKYLKNFMDVGKLIFVDLDKELLEEKSFLLKPLPAEFLLRKSRPQPLVVEAYAGCVTTVDAQLWTQNPDVWAVIGIEIIEHLHPDVLRGFEETVFGITSPHLVIVTTPNAEFNQVFNLPPGKFRHWDHKFEWSRPEFKAWCEKIVGEFPNYTYTIDGICQGPQETSHLGCVSQMAVFERKEGVQRSETDVARFAFRIRDGAYTLIQSLQFPNYKETRSREKIILDEFNYYIHYFLLSPSTLDRYEEKGVEEVTITIRDIQRISGMPAFASDDAPFLVSTLEKGGYQISERNGELSVVFNVEKVRAENTGASSDDEDFFVDDERNLCANMSELQVQPPPQVEEESWE